MGKWSDDTMAVDTVSKCGRQPVKDEGKRFAAYSLCLNIFLTAAKYLLYLFTGSSALLAETVHSLADIVGSLLVLGGIYLAARKSAQFPWGLYKAENLAALLSAGFILLSGYEIGRSILYGASGDMQHLDSSIVLLLLMALPIYFFSRYEYRKARELNSPSLLADAENWRTDLAPLAIVTAGIVGARFSYPVLDRVAAFVVLMLIAKAGYEIARSAVRSLLDASVDRETIDRISAVVKEFPQVREIVSLAARNSGRYIFADIEVRLSLKRLKEAHSTVDRIEQEIARCIPYLEKVTVHYEPEAKVALKYAVTLASRDGVISGHFGAAPFIAVWEKRESDGAILSREIIENPYTAMEKGKGIKLAELLVERQIDILYTMENFTDKGPAYVFSNAEIELRPVKGTHLNELIE